MAASGRVTYRLPLRIEDGSIVFFDRWRREEHLPEVGDTIRIDHVGDVKATRRIWALDANRDEEGGRVWLGVIVLLEQQLDASWPGGLLTYLEDHVQWDKVVPEVAGG